MRKVDLLRELQDLDTRLDTAGATLAQVRSQMGNRSALDQRAEELRRAREEHHRLDAEQRDLELRAEGQRTKMSSEERQLYSGRVTNPKELAALAEEVEQVKRHVDALEDKLLEAFEQTDAAARRVADLEAALARETAEWNSRQAQAERQAQELATRITSTEGQREAAMGRVDGSTQALYENLRRQKSGTAVAHVLQRTCQACRVALTPALEQRARVGPDLVTCQSCGRILYIPIA